jgi:thioredoxin 1
MKNNLLIITALSIVSLSVLYATQKVAQAVSEEPKVEVANPNKNVEEPMKEETKPIIVQELTAENAQKIITNMPLVIVDFFAEWCGPCKTLKPIFEEVALEFNNKYVFAKLNIDICKDIAVKYNISTIPTIMVFSNGKVIAKITGLVSKEVLIEKIEAAIKGPQDLSKISKEELNEKLWQATYSLESVEEIKRFIDAGADVNFTKNNTSPIMMIIMNCGMRGVDATPYLNLLLDSGASTLITDPTGNVTALGDAATQMGDSMRAMAQNYDKMATLIKNHAQKLAPAEKKCDGNICQL